MKILKEIVEELSKSLLPFYVYVLFKPDYIPFYVGKGTVKNFCGSHAERLEWHEYEAGLKGDTAGQCYINRHKVNTIRKIWNSGKQVLYTIDSYYELEKDAYDREKDLIAIIGRRIDGSGNLTNLDIGGKEKCFAMSVETKQKISQSLKKYYSDHPEAIELNRQNKLKYFANHPEARENMRQKALKNDMGKNIVRWIKENPEAFAKKTQEGTEIKKQWYIDNPQAAKDLADRRNKVLRSDSHRQKMAERTRDYILNNPEANAIRREKANASLRQTICEFKKIKQECLWLMHDKLVALGEILPIGLTTLTSNTVRQWNRKGLMKKYFPDCPKGTSKEVWLNFLNIMKGLR